MGNLILAEITTLDGALGIAVGALAGVVVFLFKHYSGLLDKKDAEHKNEVTTLVSEHRTSISNLVAEHGKQAEDARNDFKEESERQRSHNQEVLSHICRQFVDKLDHISPERKNDA